MRKTRLKKATKAVYTILKQIARWIPRDLVKSAAERHGIRYHAVKWQVWAGLIAHLLLRFTKHLAKCGNSFSRLAGIVRGCLWLKKDLFSLLDTYGTASGWVFRRKCARPAWIQAMLPFANAPNGTP